MFFLGMPANEKLRVYAWESLKLFAHTQKCTITHHEKSILHIECESFYFNNVLVLFSSTVLCVKVRTANILIRFLNVSRVLASDKI